MAAQLSPAQLEPYPSTPRSSVVWILVATLVGLAGATGVAAEFSSSSHGRVAALFLLSVAGTITFQASSAHLGQRVRTVAAVSIGILAVAIAASGVWAIASGVSVLSLLIGRLGQRRSRRSFEPPPDARLQDVIRSMVLASQIRDHQTADHSDRVARNSRLVGLFLGLTDSDIAGLEWAARVHDVGKAAVPREILHKPGRLTESEMELVKQHCDLGADMLVAASPDLKSIAQFVKHHHENWDGSGYPVGLVANEIPLESRIIAVIDMYEALTSDRPYRPAMEPQAAYEEVMLRSGTKFDPDVVRVFDELWRRGGIETWSSRPARPANVLTDDAVVRTRSTVFARATFAGFSTG